MQPRVNSMAVARAAVVSSVTAARASMGVFCGSFPWQLLMPPWVSSMAAAHAAVVSSVAAACAAVVISVGQFHGGC